MRFKCSRHPVFCFPRVGILGRSTSGNKRQQRQVRKRIYYSFTDPATLLREWGKRHAVCWGCSVEHQSKCISLRTHGWRLVPTWETFYASGGVRIATILICEAHYKATTFWKAIFLGDIYYFFLSPSISLWTWGGRSPSVMRLLIAMIFLRLRRTNLRPLHAVI